MSAARDVVAGCDRAIVLTGAGVSAESGVPTFRGSEGLWRQYRPEELATPEAFGRDPRLVWEWYGWRRDLVAQCEPNAAHFAIAHWVRARPERRIVTQNVDGLHMLAARAASDESEVSPADRPLELHGSLFRTRCTACGQRVESRAAIDATSEASLPRCQRCSGLLRPYVVWFGESLDPAVVETGFELAASAEVCLVVGTSAVVHPAASIAFLAADAGAALIEVNPEPTPLTALAAASLRAPAGQVLPEMLA